MTTPDKDLELRQQAVVRNLNAIRQRLLKIAERVDFAARDADRIPPNKPGHFAGIVSTAQDDIVWGMANLNLGTLILNAAEADAELQRMNAVSTDAPTLEDLVEKEWRCVGYFNDPCYTFDAGKNRSGHERCGYVYTAEFSEEKYTKLKNARLTQ